MGTVLDTITYNYGNSNWGDLLTSYDGKTITSDAIGNMTSDGTWTYTWEHGRELVSMTSGSTSWTYTYGANGLRTKRTNGSTTYTYVYRGDKLSRMHMGSTTLTMSYDGTGAPFSVTYNGTTYYYATNLQGDVVAILNSSGTSVVTYTYDAWGKLLTTSGTMASTLGIHNPLRYRGYVYDPESGLYYLQSRYYNPELGRFINADAFTSTGQGLLGNNMFAYCLNNPVNLVDPSGRVPLVLPFLIGTGIAIIVGIVSNHDENEENEEKIDEEIKDYYSTGEAKSEIEDLLSDYGDDVTVTFNDDNVQIDNSHQVSSKYDRQKVCAIISRTENYTEREMGNLSAEWNAHNAMFFVPWWTENCRNVNLDYTGDPRWYVQAATAVFEFFGWE